jgi:V/A-type H+-transporting ATPase subunit I
MALAKMKKLTLVGNLSEQGSIYNTLIDTKSVQLAEKFTFDGLEASVDGAAAENWAEKATKLTDTIRLVKAETENFNDRNKKSANFTHVVIPKRGMSRPLTELTFDSFLELDTQLDKYMAICAAVDTAKDGMMRTNAELNKIDSEITKLAPYLQLPHPTTYYADTADTTVALATSVKSAAVKVIQAASAFPLVNISEIANDTVDTALFVVVIHNSETDAWAALAAAGLTKSSVVCDVLPRQRQQELYTERKSLLAQYNDYSRDIAEFARDILDMEVMSDFIEMQLSKILADGNVARSEKAFFLTAFCPADSENYITDKLSAAFPETVLYFTDVDDTDDVPILYKNNKVVASYEGVTNMYTPPSYRDIDPNPVMALFYTIIFGLMVADIGYGLVLVLGGILASLLIKQETGMKKLLRLFGYSGIGAVLVGLLYGSMFSVELYTGIIPSPSLYPKTTMIICVLLGFFHLIAGYGINMAKQIRDKEYVAAFGVSLMWIVFFLGAFVAVLQPALNFMDYPQFAEVVLPPIMTTIGLILVGVSILTILICVGHGKKLAGRLISAFGNVYGIINLFADIMSYIRIFGLMLSSAMMGVVLNQLGGMIYGGGGVINIVLAAVMLLATHAFNLVIGVLGIYIHDGRLQYVEFFGKFYEGDGRLFTPFGSEHRFTLIK